MRSCMMGQRVGTAAYHVWVLTQAGATLSDSLALQEVARGRPLVQYLLASCHLVGCCGVPYMDCLCYESVGVCCRCCDSLVYAQIWIVW